MLVPLVVLVQMFKLVLLSMSFVKKCRMRMRRRRGSSSRSRCSRAAGTICQGITGAIRGRTIVQQAAVAGMPQQAATAPATIRGITRPSKLASRLSH